MGTQSFKACNSVCVCVRMHALNSTIFYAEFYCDFNCLHCLISKFLGNTLQLNILKLKKQKENSGSLRNVMLALTDCPFQFFSLSFLSDGCYSLSWASDELWISPSMVYSAWPDSALLVLSRYISCFWYIININIPL